MPLISIIELERYIKFAAINESVYNKFELANLRNEPNVELTDLEWHKTKETFQQRKTSEDKLFKTVRLNNESIKLKKAGNIIAAIKLNEENIIEEYPATYSYEQLMVYYRKEKDYANEIRIIQLAIKVFVKYPTLILKYSNRLKKAQLFKDKL